MKAKRSVVSVLAIAAGVLVAAAGLAWACTAQSVVSVLPEKGAAGNVVTVTGKGFSSSPVEVRWGDQEGPVFASALGPEFSVQATIPADATPGLYFLMVGERAARVVEVTASTSGNPQTTAASSAGQADLWSGFEGRAVPSDDGIGAGKSGAGAQLPTLVAGMMLTAFGLLGVGMAGAAENRRRKAHRSPQAPSQGRADETSP